MFVTFSLMVSSLLPAAPAPVPRSQLAVFRHRHPVTCVAFVPGRNALLAGDAGGRLVLWDVATSSPLYSKARTDESTARAVAFSPDGAAALITYTYVGVTLVSVDKIDVRPSDAAYERCKRAGFHPMHNTPGVLDTLVVLDVASGKERAEVVVDGPRTGGASFSPTGKEVLAAHYSGPLMVFRGKQGKPRFALCDDNASESVTRALFTEDGRQMAVLDSSKAVRLWDVRTGTVHTTLLAPATYAKKICPHRSGEPCIDDIAIDRTATKVACAGGDYAVWVTDVQTRQSTMVPNRYTWTTPPPDAAGLVPVRNVSAIALSRDGRTLAVALPDHTVQVTDLWAMRSSILRGHLGEVKALAFSPDGKTLASGSDDKTVRLWRVP